MSKQIYLILDNIRSAQNVGAIFRTADAVGVTKIFLVGYTPAPVDQFARASSQIAKAALGAEKVIPWEKVTTLASVFKKLAKEKVTIIALEQSKDSLDYKKVKSKGDWALLVGNEVEGIVPKVLKQCDVIAEIPMKGSKESLNVSVATGIALFQIAQR